MAEGDGADRAVAEPAASAAPAQAVDESDWGRSLLTAKNNNLFGIKGTGRAGSVTFQSSEYEGGRWGGVLVRYSVAPDRPGAKFRQSFGAVLVVLRLGCPATV